MSPDWARALRFGVLRLGLAPDQFWSLTLAEWRCLTAGGDAGQALSRAKLDGLLAQYPDYQTNGGS
jgi:uncharacterized phage protein (TIGR02216 family)